jgi:hypothetical protein
MAADRVTTLRLIDGSTFEATECDWQRLEGTDPDLRVTGNFQHERADSRTPQPPPLSIYIPFRSVVWWQEPNQQTNSKSGAGQ